MAKYDIVSSGSFRKDLKLAKKRGLPLKDFYDVVTMLAEDQPLPANFATTYYQVIIKATGNAISTQIGCSSTRKTPRSELSLFIVRAHILTFSKKAGNANIQPKQFM